MNMKTKPQPTTLRQLITAAMTHAGAETTEPPRTSIGLKLLTARVERLEEFVE